MLNRIYVLFAILPIVILAGCTSMGTEIAKTGDIIGVDYIGTLNDGTVFDTSLKAVAEKNNIYNPQRGYAPLEFTIGEGQMIKGFDEGVVGMKVGEMKKIPLQPEDAYGNVRSDLIVNVGASQITNDPSQLAVGGSVYTQTGSVGIIKEINNGTVTVDFNHPFAGKELNFEITLVSISN